MAPTQPQCTLLAIWDRLAPHDKLFLVGVLQQLGPENLRRTIQPGLIPFVTLRDVERAISFLGINRESGLLIPDVGYFFHLCEIAEDRATIGKAQELAMITLQRIRKYWHSILHGDDQPTIPLGVYDA